MRPTGSQLRLADLPSQDVELVSKHQQLEVLAVLAATAADEQPENGSKGEISEREEHRGMLPGSLPPAVSDQVRVLAPFTVRRRDRLDGVLHECELAA